LRNPYTKEYGDKESNLRRWRYGRQKNYLKVENRENAWNRRQRRARIEKKDEKDKVNTRAELS
jgi:hypothetical protein